MKAMILAAGQGKRLRPLTDTIPKPLIKIGKYAIIEYRLQSLASAGIKEVVINVAYKAQQIMDALGDGSRYGVKIEYSIEPEEGLETGGGIFNALPLLGNEPFVLNNADIWTDYSLQKLPKKISGLAHLVLSNNMPHHPEGDFALDGNYVIEHGAPKYTYSGIAIYDPILFKDCQPGFFSVVPLLKAAMKNKLVTGEHYPGQWVDIGTIQQLEYLRNSILEQAK